MEGKYKVFHQMHPFNSKTHSILNHTGNKTQLRQARCPCKNGKACEHCSYCTGCSCRCHQWFTLHYRFMGLKNELELLQHAESIVGSNIIPQALETKARLFSLISEDLTQEVMPNNDGICQVIEEARSAEGNEEKKRVLHQVPTEVCQLTDEMNKPKPRSGRKREVRQANGKTNETKSAVRKGGEKEGNDDNGVTRKKASIERAAVNETNATARQDATQDETMTADQPTATFHCPKCSRDIVFESVTTAGASFANHVIHCDPEKKRKKSFEKNDLANTSDSPDNGTQVTLDEILSEARPIDPDELMSGSRVIVIEEGVSWYATIRRRHKKKGEPGFIIHYDGKKSTVEDWVPIASVVNFIATEDDV